MLLQSSNTLEKRVDFRLEKDHLAIVRASLNLLSSLILPVTASILSVMTRSSYAASNCLTISLWSASQVSSWRAVWARSRSRCRSFDKNRASSASSFLSEDAFLVSRAYLTRAEVVRRAASMTLTRLAAMLSGSISETLSLERLHSPILLTKKSGIVERDL